MVELLKPKRGGFLRPFHCGWFIREFLLGNGPHNSLKIFQDVGAPQAVIFREYKLALMHYTAADRATGVEEKKAKKEKRKIEPDNITELENLLFDRMAYKTYGCRFHSFVVYFSNIKKLKWVEATGEVERSEFQDHYKKGPPRKYFRLTEAGRKASDEGWADPLVALYGPKTRYKH